MKQDQIKQNQIKQKVLWRLLKYLRPYPAVVIIALSSMLAATAAEIFLPVVMQNALDSHILSRQVQEEGPPDGAGRAERVRGLRASSFRYFMLLTAVLLFSIIQVNAATRAGQNIMADVRQQLLAHIMRQSLSYHGRTPVGSLVSRTANDVETINELFTNVAMSFLKNFSMMTGVIVAIILLDFHLALISLAAMIPTLVIALVFREKILASFRAVRSRLSRLNACLSEHLGGMRTLQLFNAQEKSRGEFNRQREELLHAELKQVGIMAVFRPLVDMMASVSVALVIWFASGLNNSGGISLGILIAFIDLIQKFFKPVSDLAEKFNIFQSAMAGGERIFSMLDTTECIHSSAGRNELVKLTESVQFKDVHFSYVPGEPVLRGISFTIPAGSTAAVVGTTGAGKTTISNLLTRLWDVNSGQILLGGQDIRSMPLEQLRGIVQPVNQDVFLFTGSIAENISLGKPIPMERVREAARITRADAFIRQLPEGYNTQITEGASNLSAGERQLIAFARILAHNPRIIILDEATAAIDTATEKLIQEGLERVLSGRTAILIAHRLSTIRRADTILVMSHGRLVEQGAHKTLMAQNGVYANLYRIQFSGSQEQL